MSGQRLRLFLQVSIGLLAIGTPAVLAWAFFWPVQEPGRASDSTLESKKAEVQLPEPRLLPGPDEFGLLAYKPLQQELVTEQTALLLGQRQVVLKVAVPPPVQLLATMVEPDQSAALFSTADGAMKWCRIGESIGEATPMQVIAIEPAKVVVRYLGQDSTVEIPNASDG